MMTNSLVHFLLLLAPLSSLLFVSSMAQLSTGETNSDDVNSITLLQNTYYQLQPSKGDPCLPTPFTWVNCSSDDTPRITALDLNTNILSQEIPAFFANFPKLKVLNLANNYWYGTVPPSLSKNKKLKLDVSGNAYLCTSENGCQTGTETSPGTHGTTSTFATGNSKKSKKKLPVILGTVIPTFVVFWVIVGAVAIFQHQKKSAAIAAITAGQMDGAAKPGMPMQAMPVTPERSFLGTNNQVGEAFAAQTTTDYYMVEPGMSAAVRAV